MENTPIDQHEMHKRKKYRKLLLVIFAITLVFYVGYETGKEANQPALPVSIKNAKFENTSSQQATIDFTLFWTVWDLLKHKYVDSSTLDANELFYGAIKGMLAATGDPYTTFFDAEENKKFNEEISGNFEGIGAELGIKNNVLTIVAPLQGTPAEKAGLRSGDKIIKIDGKPSQDMSIEDAVNIIRGPKGTSVTLTIFREGEQDTREVKVERNVINVKSVTVEFKENEIAYIKVTRFGDDTSKTFADAIHQLKNKKSKGIILDLRNNPGGYLETAVDMASKMIPQNKVVVIEESSDKSQKKIMTRGGDVTSGLQTVVLINEGSASASEILAGALREDRENVTLVGKKSFGKGSVQEFIELPQGTAAKITVARWLTPNGNQINEHGIGADVEQDLTTDDYNNNRDPQLDKALEILKSKI